MLTPSYPTDQEFSACVPALIQLLRGNFNVPDAIRISWIGMGYAAAKFGGPTTLAAGAYATSACDLADALEGEYGHAPKKLGDNLKAIDWKALFDLLVKYLPILIGLLG